MKKEFSISDPPLPIDRQGANGFTLVEVMVVVVLLSLIVLALMAVFDSTQRAFRASITQTDMLEGGRAAIDFMAGDLRAMSPSMSADTNAVNFYVSQTNYSSPPSPLSQTMVASGNLRQNVLDNFFILSKGNANGVPTWYGVGYAVCADPSHLYSLYRFATNHSIASEDPSKMFVTDFGGFLTNITAGSHLMDGVVHLVLRAYDTNGVWMNYGYTNASDFITNGQTTVKMFNHTLPSTVEIEMGVLEDRTLQRAESLPAVPQAAYLTNALGQLHIFRERIAIPNVDPSAYK